VSSVKAPATVAGTFVPPEVATVAEIGPTVVPVSKPDTSVVIVEGVVVRLNWVVTVIVFPLVPMLVAVITSPTARVAVVPVPTVAIVTTPDVSVIVNVPVAVAAIAVPTPGLTAVRVGAVAAPATPDAARGRTPATSKTPAASVFAMRRCIRSGLFMVYFFSIHKG
jgi:hypothetical protein